MFTTLITLALAPFAGAVADPTPVGAAIVEIVIDDPAVATPVCDNYRQVMGLIDGLGLDDPAVFIDMVDAYTVVTIEGVDMRLDNDARTTLTNWLHTDCS